MPSEVLREILHYIIQKYPHFDTVLLSYLQIAGVITPCDSAIVQSKVLPIDKGLALFLQVLPLKSNESIRKCFDILRNNFERECDLAFLNEQQNRYECEAKAEEAAAKLSHTKEAYDKEIKNNQLEFEEVAANIPGSSSPKEIKNNQLEFEKVAADIPGSRSPIRENSSDGQVIRMRSGPFDAGPGGNQYYDNYSYGGFGSHDEAKRRGGASAGISAISKVSGVERPRPKGVALVINNKDYENGIRRRGSHIDVRNITHLLEQLEYQIVKKQNLKAERMYQEVQNFVDEDIKSHHKSCIVVIMAHGQKEKFMGIDGGLVAESALLDIVKKNEKLVGKPKVFIIQACRGGLTHDHLEFMARADDLYESMLSGVKIPIGADTCSTCILHSTMPGYYSWRIEAKGSWFISALCKEFSEHAHEPWADLLCLATRVIDRVSSTAITTIEWERVLQLPQVISNIRRKFHFFPGYEMLE